MLVIVLAADNRPSPQPHGVASISEAHWKLAPAVIVLPRGGAMEGDICSWRWPAASRRGHVGPLSASGRRWPGRWVVLAVDGQVDGQQQGLPSPPFSPSLLLCPFFGSITG